MKIHQLSPDEALLSLQSSRAGLPEAVAQERLVEFGPNRIEVREKKSQLRAFVRQFTHLFALLLWVAAGFAFFQGYANPESGMATLGWAILLVLLINGVFAYIQEYKAEHAIDLLLGMLPSNVKVVRQGHAIEEPAENLVPGDLIRISAGDKIPAECRVIESAGLRVDEAVLTGESTPRTKTAEPDHAGHIENESWRSANILMAGTLALSGRADALVFATGPRTEFGKVVRLTESLKRETSPLQREIGRLSQRLALLSFGVGAVFFGLGHLAGLPSTQTALFALGVLVANIPEGLLPTVTLALALAAQRMARRHAIVRHLPSVETLGSVTVICTDKTGTLTQNKMAVREISPPEAGTASTLANQNLRLIARNCHALEKITERGGRNHWRGDPLDRSLVTWAEASEPLPEELPKQGEIPFDSDRRRMTSFHPGWVLSKGAVEAILPLCTSLQFRDSQQPLGTDERDRIEKDAREMAGRGLRVLAFACAPRPGTTPSKVTAEPSEKDLHLCFVGLIGFQDPPRPEVPDAIQRCFQSKIRVVMVTGDHPLTAQAIAREIGLLRPEEAARVITGEQLRHYSESQLQLALDQPGLIFARVDSTQKVKIVRAFKRKRQIVAVTGDGVNDAPALKEANIGIAMGISGTDVARDSADIVLLDDNFATIVSAVEEGRAVFHNIRKFLTYMLTSNIPELLPYLAYVFFKVPLALTVIQILAVDLGTDLLPALALGAESPSREVMQKGPRPPDERLATRSLFIRAYLFLGLIEAVAALGVFFLFLASNGWEYGIELPRNSPVYLQATSACLTTIVVMQVANLFICRAGRARLGEFPIRANRLLLPGIAFELILLILILYTGAGNALFGTAAPAPWVWTAAAFLAIAMLLINEAAKRLRARRPVL